MIRILSVQGDVLVDDKRRGYQQVAHNGMVLEAGGDYLVATNATSRASIDLGGSRVIKLEPLSFLHVGPAGKPRWDRHGLWPSGDVRLWLGRLWAKCGASHDRFGYGEEKGSAGGGARG